MATTSPTSPPLQSLRPSALKTVKCSSSVPSKDHTSPPASMGKHIRECQIKWKRSQVVWTPVLGERASYFVHYEADFASYLSRAWKENGLANKYYKAALRREVGEGVAHVRAEYAEFAWKEMGDFETAEEMFGRAVEEAAAPLHALLAGRYAHFMWTTSQD